MKKPNIRDLEAQTNISYHTLYGNLQAHDESTLLIKVLQHIGLESLEQYYTDTIHEEELLVTSKKDLEEKLINTLYDTAHYDIIKNDIFDIKTIPSLALKEKQTGKMIILEIKPVMQYGKTPAKLMHDLKDAGKKDFGESFELIIITFSRYRNIVEKHYKGLDVRYIGDILNIDEDKLILLPDRHIKSKSNNKEDSK